MYMEENKDMEEKIKHVLEIFPIISPTMLQIGIGPQVPPKVWRPVLNRLIDEGIVVQDTVGAQNTTGRHLSYTRLFLATEGKSDTKE